MEQGVVIGKGYSPNKDEHIRIANFPAMNEAVFGKVVSHLKSYGN